MTGPQRAAAEQRDPRPGEANRGAVRIWLLGGFRVSVGSRTIGDDEWRLKKAGSLVKLLALAPHHRLHREQVMDLLWPDLEADAATNNLHRTLHFARRTLEPPPTTAYRYLRLREGMISLSPDGPLWVDVEAFEDAASTARRGREPAAYRAAIDLYAGELLPGDRYEEWAQHRREELRRAYLELLAGLGGLHEEREEYGPAIEVLERILANEPAHEEAHAGLMRLYALSGQRHRALRQYEQLREVLREELGTEPEAESRRLRGEILAGRFPAARPPERHPAEDAEGERRHNLPAPKTSFIGREGELVEVERLLSMTRLLTLTGGGGSGKTRLAVEVAARLAGAYPGGAWLAELAPLSDPELVPSAVAAALGVRERPGRRLADSLADSLRSERLLLVVDNCEHLIYACAGLVDTLLGACPRLSVLATSRETLGVAGEVAWRVRPLSLPGPRSSPTVEELSGYESVRLFLDRARSRLPGFELTPGNAQAVVQICRKLDGVPLAIELATARMGALAVEQVAERLEDSLKLLTTGGRTSVLRQRTLGATLDWSHDLLSEEEKILFRRLPVFSGGFSLEAAEAVCAGEGRVSYGRDPSLPRDLPVLDLLSRLVDKSLVLVAEQRSGEARYRLLETVRQYGREKLDESGEAPEMGHRHAGFFLGLAERAEPELAGAQQEAWLDRLEAEHDNLRAALSWSLEGGEPEIGLRLAGALWRFCYTRGYYGEGREWLEAALARTAGSPATLRAKALTGAGILTFLQCEYGPATALLEESLALYRSLDDRRGVASALQTLGSIARERGRYARAVALHEESLALQRELGDAEGIARSLDGLGFVAWLQQEYERAGALCAEALAVYRGLEDVEGVAWSLVNLGAVAQHRGDHERAGELLDESLALSRRAGYKEGVAWSLNQLGIVEQRRGDHELATTLLLESLEIHRDLGDRWRAASVLEGLAGSIRERPEREARLRAARLLGVAEALRETIGAPVPPCERAAYDRTVSELRAVMGEEAFAKARAEGRAMSLEQAVEHVPGKASPTQEAPSALTRREREIAALIAQGLTNRQIASELTISEHTVVTHVREIRKKLGFHSRTQIAAWVTEQQLSGG